jgi:Rieske Fe-S protein
MEPVDGLPYIGLNPGSKNLYVATGYSGNGMTFGTLAGMMISDAIVMKENASTQLYLPSRIKPMASAVDYLLENKDFPIHLLKDHISPAEVDALSEIHPGEGKTIRANGKKIAVYRDKKGDLQAFSSVCPHLGCSVHWNSAEKSWDCPCHGSRFDTDGQVLHGPALKGLSPIDIEDVKKPAGGKKGAA